MSLPEDQNKPEETGTPVPVSPPSNEVPEKGIGDPTRFLDELEKSATATTQPAPAATEEANEVTQKLDGGIRNTIAQTTTIQMEPISEGENRNRPEIMTTPSAPLSETLQRLGSITAAEVEGKRHYAQWIATINQSLTRNSFNSAADDIFAREGSHWVQRMDYGNAKIGNAANRQTVGEGEILTGAAAINAAQRHVGIGGNFSVVLPHSGFWVTMKPPMEESILELNRQINQIKTEVGKRTYGLLLGAESGLVNELFTRFALTSMLRNSIKDVDDILAVLSVHDINVLNWGYMSTIYPNGFNHRAACTADTSKCQHIVEDLINVRRLFFMDKSRFSDEQLAHLSSSAAGSMSVESVTKYRESMRASEERTIVLNEGEESEVRLELRVPSAKDYFESTHRWIDGIGDKVVESLGADSAAVERNLLINEHASATQMRKFAHWVKRIHIGEGVVDREKSGFKAIEDVLDSWSSSRIMREEFSEKVEEYIKDTCVALIGVPDFKCPSCHQYQITPDETNHLHRSIIGIDVPMTFFTVLVQRAQLIKA